MKGVFCQHKSTFHKETVEEIRVTAIPFYMGFDESEITHWVSDAQFFLSNCKVHFWCINFCFSFIRGATVSGRKNMGEQAVTLSDHPLSTSPLIDTEHSSISRDILLSSVSIPVFLPHLPTLVSYFY